MNWGTKVTVVFSLFVAGILAMVFKASRQNIDLVMPDYYEQELKYQARIDEINRTSALATEVKCKIRNDAVEVILPAEMKDKNVQANIWLYCIADKNKDATKQVYTTDAKLLMPLAFYNKGLHDIKIQWTCADSSYYFEQKLFIQ